MRTVSRFLILLLLITSGGSWAETPIISANGPQDKAELNAFIQQWVDENLTNSNTPGLSVTLVHNNQVMLNKGFGVSNISTGQLVDADSVFRIASVSKVFVGMAVAQLVEKGQLDLNRDINEYLDNIQVPKRLRLSKRYAPVSLKHLLSHTARFDEQFWADLTTDLDQQQPLAIHLANNLPPRVGAPGKMIDYSNYGYALAAYIVEVVSGEDFSAYVDKNILQPLEMGHSGYRLNAPIKANLVTGYAGKDTDLTARPYTYVHRYPPTSMMTSANDMANFITALLNRGQLNSNQIYGPAAATLMSDALYTADPAMPGQTAGFMQWHRWGHKILWHDGSHVGFNAQLMLFPELDSGFYISVNNKHSNLASDLKYALLHRYYQPQQKTTLTAPFKAFSDHLALEGEYINSRRAHGNIAKMLTLLRPNMIISANDDGTIDVDGVTMAEQQEDLFAYVKRPDMKLKVVKKADNSIDFIAFDYGGSPRAYEKPQLVDNLLLHRLIFALLLLSFLLVSLSGLSSRFKPRKKATANGIGYLALPCSINLFFSLLIVYTLATVDSLMVRMGNVPLLLLLLSIPMINIPIVIYGLAKTATKKLQPAVKVIEPSANVKNPSAKVWFLVLLVNLLFFYELYYWQLLGFHFSS
jgi:CubicO group peptidase (beta-lactamase class C family)